MFGSTDSEYFRINFSILIAIRLEQLNGFARHFSCFEPLTRMPFNFYLLKKIS
jgi:hypothetical protein